MRPAGSGAVALESPRGSAVSLAPPLDLAADAEFDLAAAAPARNGKRQGSGNGKVGEPPSLVQVQETFSAARKMLAERLAAMESLSQEQRLKFHEANTVRAEGSSWDWRIVDAHAAAKQCSQGAESGGVSTRDALRSTLVAARQFLQERRHQGEIMEQRLLALSGLSELQQKLFHADNTRDVRVPHHWVWDAVDERITILCAGASGAQRQTVQPAVPLPSLPPPLGEQRVAGAGAKAEALNALSTAAAACGGTTATEASADAAAAERVAPSMAAEPAPGTTAGEGTAEAVVGAAPGGPEPLTQAQKQSDERRKNYLVICSARSYLAKHVAADPVAAKRSRTLALWTQHREALQPFVDANKERRKGQWSWQLLDKVADDLLADTAPDGSGNGAEGGAVSARPDGNAGASSAAARHADAAVAAAGAAGGVADDGALTTASTAASAQGAVPGSAQQAAGPSASSAAKFSGAARGPVVGPARRMRGLAGPVGPVTGESSRATRWLPGAVAGVAAGSTASGHCRHLRKDKSLASHCFWVCLDCGEELRYDGWRVEVDTGQQEDELVPPRLGGPALPAVFD